jgi:hypothetical protein
MKTKTLVFLFCLFSGFLKALTKTEEMEGQITLKEENKKEALGLRILGRGTILFNQSAFHNWRAGGVNALSGIFLGNLRLVYTAEKSFFDLDTHLNYGLSLQEGYDEARKTEDIMNLNLTYGKSLVLGFFGIVNVKAQSQITKGYEYAENGSKTLISSPFSPGYTTIGFGFEFRSDLDFSFSILPFTYKNSFVLDGAIDKTSYGVEQAKDILSQSGFSIDLSGNKEIAKNVTIINKMFLFCEYEDKVTVDVNWELRVDFKVNDIMSANLIGNLIYDEDVIVDPKSSGVEKYLQAKNYFGLGLTYNLHPKSR